MSSTPAITSTSTSWSSARHGAKPTPQLPITAVVTPCADDGVMPVRPDGLPVVVGVQVDEAGRDEQPGRVDLPVASPSTVPTAAITPSETATSPTKGSPPRPSTMVPLRMIKSYAHELNVRRCRRSCQDGAVIDHFGINCADWEKSKAFYDKVLGVLGYTRQMDYQRGHRLRQGRQARLLDRRHERGRGERAPTARCTSRSRPQTPTPSQAFYDTALEARRRVAARAAAVAGVPPRLLRRLRPRPGRQQRRGRLPRRTAGVAGREP